MSSTDAFSYETTHRSSSSQHRKPSVSSASTHCNSSTPPMITSYTAVPPAMQAGTYFPPDLAVNTPGHNPSVSMPLPEMMPQQHSQPFSSHLMTPPSTAAFSSNYSFPDYPSATSMQQVNFGGSQYSSVVPEFAQTFAQPGNSTSRISQHRSDSPPRKRACPGSGFQCPCDPSSCMCERCFTHNQGLDWCMPGFLPASTNTQDYQQMPPHDLAPESQLDLQWAQWRDDETPSSFQSSQLRADDFTPLELDLAFPLT